MSCTTMARIRIQSRSSTIVDPTKIYVDRKDHYPEVLTNTFGIRLPYVH